MIASGQFDRDLGAMVRDPKNANKTASELLRVQEAMVRDKLADCNCTDKLRYLLVFAVGTLIGGLVWLLPW